MVPTSEWMVFAAAVLLLVLTPGPNVIYLLSRSVCQGRRAGVLSAFGVAAGSIVHVIAAAAGLTAIFLAVPLAYDVLRWAGVAYLLHLAWQAAKPGARSPFEPRELPIDSSRRLLLMGFLTNLLNPKTAMIYLSIVPQFVKPEHGSVFVQSVQLGLTQVAMSFSVHVGIALFAARLASWLSSKPGALMVQRYAMASVLCALAVRMAREFPRSR